jgi:hypothetical protein
MAKCYAASARTEVYARITSPPSGEWRMPWHYDGARSLAPPTSRPRQGLSWRQHACPLDCSAGPLLRQRPVRIGSGRPKVLRSQR